jgi:sensor histidine kinase regulating citrate/malate metabolism
VLEVCDNGLGIDLTRYGHQIFKLNKVFHKGFDSKGLGLFILKNQIETLGGKISVNSEPNQGSAFKVVF